MNPLVICIFSILALFSSAESSSFPEDRQRDNSKRIVGGSTVARGDLPFVVAIASSTYGQFCGGAVIHEEFILTAAHCFNNYTLVNIIIYSFTLTSFKAAT